jgi:hypothetical protein
MQLNDHQIRELVEESKADEVGLWFIVAKVRDELGISEPQSVRAVVMDTVQRLLDSGEVIAGYYQRDGSGVAAWNLDTATVLTRINTEWDHLGRDPNIGEVVVFIGALSY